MTPVKTEYPLTSITWLYRGLKLELVEVTWFSDWIAGSCQVNLLKTEKDCSEAGLKIKSYPNYNFFFYRNVVLLFSFVYMVTVETENRI